jgi:putative endonuclease
MFLTSKELAAKGEELAAKILKEKGYEIIERNYRYGHGEIDIIAIDPGDGYTVFVEVKTRKNLEYGEPEYAITKTKQKQIRKIAELYLFLLGWKVAGSVKQTINPAANTHNPKLIQFTAGEVKKISPERLIAK